MAGPSMRNLSVLLNGRRAGALALEKSGAITFRYDPAWLSWEHALPVSLSMPLREERFVGDVVVAVFDNLLPDNREIRTRIAERTGANGIDAISLLAAIGGDCVGALQFVPEGLDPPDSANIRGRPISDQEIENIIRNLERAPLGIGAPPDFRVSIAGVQEKTALLRRDGKWEIPLGPTPTTHILKPAIGRLANGLDLSQSVENEHFCLTFLAELGLPAARSQIATFGKTRVLVIERFDRMMSEDRLLRRPQEDMCQALAVPWTRKYENEGGPGILRILDLLGASEARIADRKLFLTAQIAFWLMGATDGHAKNFSIHLLPGYRFAMAPLYDVLSAQPNVDANHLRLNQFKLAMAVGDARHYAIDDILPRHYRQTGQRAGMSASDITNIFADLLAKAPAAMTRTIAAMPKPFPATIAGSIARGVMRRLSLIA